MSIHHAAFAAGLVLASHAVLAQGILGSFKGTEKLVVSNCGRYDGTSSNAWWATHSKLEGASYVIEGGTSNGSFSGKATLDGNTSSGKVSGVDKQGSAWTATTMSTLDDDKFSGRSSGTVTGTPCTFTSELEAQRIQ